MTRSMPRALILFLALIITTTTVSTSAADNTVVARFDLNQKEKFDAFSTLGISPFFRIGNNFFAEVDQNGIAMAQQGKILYEVIDDQPFSAPYYAGTAEALPSLKIPAPDLERLADADGLALYKAIQPINMNDYRILGFEPVEVLNRKIPLVYLTMAPASVHPKVSATDPVLEGLVAAVDQDSLYAYDSRLQAFQTRLSLSDSSVVARDWIKAKFESFGYTDATNQQFWISSNRYGLSGNTWNIVCVKPGTAEPDKVVVIGGHWDTIVYDGNDPYVFAPGSDDDGSGTVATLEAARLLATVPCKKTIVFIAFGAEENGLNGSWYYAANAAAMGMEIELMINMDMIGYTDDAYPDIETSYLNGTRPYAELMAQMAEDHTWLVPDLLLAGGSSDHYSFYQNGFNIANTIESDFNYPGWHTVLDLISEMDWPYFTEATKMCLATLYTVANYPSLISDAIARDVGDGQSLQIEWTALSAPDIDGYRIFWGSSSMIYDDSVYATGGTSNQTTINGLVSDQTYYLTAVAVDTDGNESFLRPEFTGTPRIVPQAPTALAADPGVWQIELSWEANQEVDFDHYNIYRGTQPGVYSPLQANVTSTTYTDTDVSSGIMYEYAITAVDLDVNESAYSAPAEAAAATFDQGILIVDATSSDAGNPTPAQKEAFFNAAFSGLPFAQYTYNSATEDLNKSVLGQYQAVFWIDDGNAASTWKQDDVDKMKWYLSYGTNVMLAGWRVAYEFSDLTSPRTLTAGNLLYDYAGVYSTLEVTDVDLQGGIGQSGFPNVALDPDKVYSVWYGKMGWIGTITNIRSGTEIIYTFDSYSGSHSGATVGVRRDNGTNKFAFISMPFYYLEDTDAYALVGAVSDWFGIEQTCDCSQFGDVNRDGDLNPVDVVYMVNYVYKNQDARLQLTMCPGDNGDWDCNGSVNPVDVVYYVNYVYKNFGSGPCDPCACSPYPDTCP